MNTTVDTLTSREVEVLQSIADHPSLRDVAYHLHVSYNTVKWYTRQIYGKLEVNSREEAIKKAWGIGLLNGGASVAHNLPALMTQFVGRKQELDDISFLLLDAQTRLVTILATGGMGKTRLALEIAHGIVTSGSQPTQPSHFSDGIYFVSLASIDLPEFVLSTIGGAIKFTFHEGPNPKQQLLDYLRDKNMLLIMDNFEHVLDATSLIIEILQIAPDITILVTSRERLKLNAETVYTLDGMAIPNMDSGDDILGYEAVQLFLQCAKRSQYDFEPDADEIDDIRRICHLTDGMPLAIILAAAWLDTLSIGEIADEIARNLDILQTEMRDIPQRLHSVRAVFETVWGRMSDAERGVFLRLSVFRGGCSREAAEEVAGARPRILQELINKAVLTQAESGHYDLHELLRQYAEARLRQTPEVYHSVRDQHCIYYSEVIAQWEWWNHTPTGYKGMKTTAETDWENLTSAWSWAGHHGLHKRLWQMLYPVACVPWHRGWFQEAAWLCSDVIDAIEGSDNDEKDELLLASLTATHAFFCNYLDQSDVVNSSALKSLSYLDNIEGYSDQPEMFVALRSMAMDLRDVRPTLARKLAEECIRLCQIRGEMSHLVWAYFEWTMVEFAVLGNTGEAKPVIEEALHLAKQQDIANMTMLFTHLLGAVYYQEGNMKEARRLANETLDMARSYDDNINSITPLVLLGDISLKEGHYSDARRSYHDALVGFNKISRKPRFALSLFAGMAELYAKIGDLEEATKLSTFVANHPFRNAYWLPHERAEQLLTVLESQLPGNVFTNMQDQGKSTHIDAVFDQLLNEFASVS